jgi:hypothetical protein
MSILEALACGAPVVTTPVGAIPEVLADGRDAIFVRPGDPEGLADAIGSLLDDPERRGRLSEAGRIKAGDFDAHRIVRRLRSLYRTVLEEPSEDPVAEAFRQAWNHASERDWAGIDPYDALTSPLMQAGAKVLGRPFAIAATQLLKRSPLDLRPVLGIGPAVNSKALALFLSSASRASLDIEIEPLAERLLELASPGYRSPCWGYPFPWWSRSFHLPARTPTVVVTSFAGEALLDAHAATGRPEFLQAALGSCEFLLESLHRKEDDTGACLSYSPLDRTAVYNASVLGARLLVLAGLAAGKTDLLEHAGPLVSYVLARQSGDGSWPYGDARHHRWIDSFHTGFVLCALDEYARATGDAATERAVELGLDYYRNTFFGPLGEPFYHPDRRYPLDIHSAAQAVLTFLRTSDRHPSHREKASVVCRWMVEEMLDRKGRFRYQIRRTHRVSIPYMRWSQAWGVRALAEMIAGGRI